MTFYSVHTSSHSYTVSSWSHTLSFLI